MGMRTPRANDLVKQCLEALALHGIPAWRQNTGAVKIQDRFVRFGVKGTPDILGIIPRVLRKISGADDVFVERHQGVFLGVEAKTGKAVSTPEQIAFRENAIRAGGICLVVHSPQEMLALLKEHGAL